MAEQINLTSGTLLTAGVLVTDIGTISGGAVDAIPSRTLVGTQVVDAAVEIQSTQGGLLFPRMTNSQMNALVTTNGMVIYNTTFGALYVYSSGAWMPLISGSGGSVTSISQGTNMSFSVNPITTTGTINLSNTLTGLTSVGVGNLTLSGSNIASSGSVVLQTNGTTTALTLDASQNATFVGNVTSNRGVITSGTASTTGSFITFSSSGGKLTQTIAPMANTANYTISWPNAVASVSGYVLSSDTSGNLSWVSPSPSGTANTLAYFNSGGTLSSSSIISNGLNILTMGTISAGGLTMTGSNLNSSSSMVFGTNGSTTALTLNTSQNAIFAGQVNIGSINISGTTIESSGNLVLQSGGTTTALTLDTIQNATFTGDILLQGSNTIVLGSNETSGTTFSPYVILYESSTKYLQILINNSSDNTGHIITNTIPLNISSGAALLLQTNGTTTALTLDTSQNATVVGNITSSLGTINLGTASTHTGSAVFFNSTNAGTLTHTVPSTGITTYTLTWPSAVASSNGQVLTSTTGGVLSWTTPTTGTVTSITQGTNMSFSVSPITTTGTINLASTLTGLTSVGVGSITISGTSINSSGQLTLGTNGTTTALTLDTSQNASFPQKIILSTNSSSTGIYSFNANSAAFGIMMSADFGNFKFVGSGASTGSNWGVYDNNGNKIFAVFNNGSSGLISVNNTNIQSSSSLVLQTNGSTTALSIATNQNATFAASIGLAGDIIFNTNSTSLGLFSNTGFAGSGGTYFDAAAGNIRFSGGNTSNTWQVYSSTGGTILYLFNNSSSTNSVGINAGNLVLQSTGGALSHTVPTSMSANYTITWPAAAPTNAGFLNVANSGTTAWVTGRCSFQSSGAQSISTSTTTAVQFGTTNYNQGGVITVSGTGNTTFTNSSGSTIYVLITYNVNWATTVSSGTYLETYIFDNSSTQYALSSFDVNSAHPVHGSTGSTVLTMNNGDSFTITVFQDSGSSMNVSAVGAPNTLDIWQLA